MKSKSRVGRHSSVGVAIAMAATLSVGVSAFADHCNSYRGPGGQVPPTGRVPTDPPPPPPAITPRPPRGTPAPVGTPIPGLTGARPGGGTGGPKGGVTTPRRKRCRTEGFERWEFWWEYNKDALLSLRTRLGDRDIASGSSDFYLGSGDRSAVRLTTRPGERQVFESVVPELVRAAEDDYYLVRDAAVLALGKIGAPGTLPAIQARLRDEHREVQESAALALGLSGDDAALPVLVSLMKDDDASHRLTGRREILTRTRGFAAVGLGLLGDERAVPDLLATLDAREPQQDVQACAALALGILGSTTATDGLSAVLADRTRDEFLRAYAATSLGKIGDARAIPVLESSLRDGNLHVARSSVMALGLFGGDAAALAIGSVKDVAEKGRDVQSRNWALISLGRMGGAAAKKTLLSAMENEHGSTRAFAALGLALLGTESPDASLAAYLRQAMADVRDPSVKGAFAIALGLLRDKASETSLVDTVKSPGPVDLRGYAAVALGLMDARGATPVIESLLQDANEPELQRAAATALGLMGDRGVVGLLAGILKTTDGEYMLSSAAMALGTIGDQTAIAPLLDAARESGKLTGTARAYATTALGLLCEPTVVPKMSLIARDVNYRAQFDAVKTLLTML